MNRGETGCIACDLLHGRRELTGGTIYRSENWAVEHCVGPLGVGTLIVKPVRHVLALGELTPNERAEMGPLLGAASECVQTLTSAGQVYTCLWSHAGWEAVHVHFVVQPSFQRYRDRYPGPGPNLQSAMFKEGNLPPSDDVRRFADAARDWNRWPSFGIVAGSTGGSERNANVEGDLEEAAPSANVEGDLEIPAPPANVDGGLEVTSTSADVEGRGCRVHLVDGTFELFRCYHGAPRALDVHGKEAGAVRGLISTLVKLLRTEDVTHVAVAVDQAVAGRTSAKDEARSREPGLAAQHGRAAEAIRALGIRLWPMARAFQADDALATGALRFKHCPDVRQVVICTTDKDLAEVVDGERVVLWNRVRDVWTNEDGVRKKFGVAPKAIPEFLGLVGDAADGLPGVPGWGPKSASTVLSVYPTIEEIPLSSADWNCEVRGAEKLARTLAEARDEAILCRDLAKLRRDVPIHDSIEDLRWLGAHRETLTQICEEIDLPEVLDRIPLWR